MSIYDQRTKPAYSNGPVDPAYSLNPYILKWWTLAHDTLLANQIALHQWGWIWSITKEITNITDPLIIEEWKSQDPICQQYVWYNVLMYFARSRAERLGLTKAIRKPAWRTCPLCDQKFIETSLPQPLVERLGINRLEFCAPCLRDTVFQGSGNDTLEKEKVLTYLNDLAALLGRVPVQNFGEGMKDLLDLELKSRLALLRLLQRKPTVNRVKQIFGSWLQALIEAGILEDGTRKTNRGIQCIAKDGHICLSLGEKTIDDFLFARKIPHEKEPRYPEGNFRGDFSVNAIIIEYFGLVGNPDYDAKILEKKRICKKHEIGLTAIYPEDLINEARLYKKLAPILKLTEE